MIYRFAAIFSFLMLLTVPASGLNIPQQPDARLAVAVERMKAGDYRKAMDAALQAAPDGARDFLIGMAAVRLGDWEKAAEHLGMASTAFPLLADYAVYNRALALYRLGRYAESLTALDGFLKVYPESPLVRLAAKLRADSLYDKEDVQGALSAYQSFIEKYATGTDALDALHRLALCREKAGDLAGAVAALRDIWLRYPASPVAAGAEEDLQRIAGLGCRVAPYTAEELLRRGTVLSDLKKYDKALKTFSAIPLDGEPDNFKWRLLLKTGQTQFRARHFREAEQTLADLLARNPGREIVDETSYWLAKAVDKNGRENEAFTLYAKLAETSPKSNLADDALLAAAYIRKFQGRTDEEITCLKTLVQKNPGSGLARVAYWEIAWTSYQSGDMKTAADFFGKLLLRDDTRDRALYWYGRTLAASGDEKGAAHAFTALVSEYPFGFYTLSYKRDARIKEEDVLPLPADLCAILPMPAGYDRAKALIAFGLYDDASRELSASRKKAAGQSVVLAGLARLYLEMGDFHGAYSLLRERRLAYPDRNNLTEWGIAYPLAFREEVAANARLCGMPQSLVYAVIRAESNYYPSALSPAGAVGLMQVMPATAAAVARGEDKHHPEDLLTSPSTNIRLGVRHLKDLLKLYDGDQVLAIAAYNAGSGNVSRWLKTFGKMPRELFIENIPFPETREYVKKVLAWAEIYKKLYKLDAPAAPNSDTVSGPLEIEPVKQSSFQSAK